MPRKVQTVNPLEEVRPSSDSLMKIKVEAQEGTEVKVDVEIEEELISGVLQEPTVEQAPVEEAPRVRDKNIQLKNAMQTLINNRNKLLKRKQSLQTQMNNLDQTIKENEECIISTHLAIKEDQAH